MLAHFLPSLAVDRNDGDDSYINGASASDQLVVEHVLHRMRRIGLPEAKARVSQADVLAVVFHRIVKVFLAFDVPALCLREEERVLEKAEVSLDGVIVGLDPQL